MIRMRGVIRNNHLELEQPLGLADGTVVEVEVRLPGEGEASEREAWDALAGERLDREWDNPADAVYDDWRRLPGAGAGEPAASAAGWTRQPGG
jgi:hypothetical protein